MWREAIRTELRNHIKKGTFRDLDRTKGERTLGSPLGTMILLSQKFNEDGSVARYKARLVCLGNRQKHMIHYDETFSPVAGMPLVRMFLAFVAEQDLECQQIDIVTAFLHSEIDFELNVHLEPALVSQFQELASELGMEPMNDHYVKRMVKARSRRQDSSTLTCMIG